MTKTVRSRATIIGNAIIMHEPRICECGCGEALPERASIRRRFLNNTHRSRAFRHGVVLANRGVKTITKSVRTAHSNQHIHHLGKAAAEGDSEALQDLRQLEKSLDKVSAIIKKAKRLR